MNFKQIVLISVVFLTSFYTSFAQITPEEETTFTLYGFGRTNFVWDSRDMGRSDLYVPANIQIGGPKNPSFFIGAKQARFGLDVKHHLGNEILAVKFEGDFHNDASDATGIFRMRHAYAEYKFIMIGMNWSNFFDVDANPATVDFEGPNSSTLTRTPQLRFSTFKSKNVLSISFENPIEKITVGGNIKVLPERFPDIITAYRINGKFGFLKAAALFRELRYQSDESRSLMSYGVTLLSSINVGEKDKIKFQGVMGTGVSKYIQGAVGLNYDAIYNGTNELESLQMQGFNFSYQHYWNDHLFSSLTAGVLNVEDNANLEDDDYKTGYYGAANLFWDPIKNLTFGFEALIGERIDINRQSGASTRIQMNATYKFNKSFK